MESLLCAKHCSTVENKVWARSSNISQSGWGGRSTHSRSHRRWQMVPEGYLENKTSKFEKMNEIPAGRWGGRLEVEAGAPAVPLSVPPCLQDTSITSKRTLTAPNEPPGGTGTS